MSTLPLHLQSLVTANQGVYGALPTHTSIRLMKLHPGHEGDGLSCSLEIVDLQQSSSFEALSYCWGNEVAETHLLCNGHKCVITKNLYLALRVLRLPYDERYLWIDAVCINQDSILERNDQVKLMRQIYEKAAGVIVWLGEEDQKTSLALTTAQNIFNECCSRLFGHIGHEECISRLQNEESAWDMLRADIAKTATPVWPSEPKACAGALRHLFERPWFFRVWVIQEVQGCPDILVQIGARTIQWDVISVAAVWVVYAPPAITLLHEPYNLGGFVHADMMRNKGFSTSDDVPFLRILDRFRELKCTIGSDRVFALLQHRIHRLEREEVSGLSITRMRPLGIEADPYATHLALRADYNMTLLEVYRQVVLGSISESGSLQVLTHIPDDGKFRADYPTWMPLWHVRLCRYTGPSHTSLYHASKGYEAQLAPAPSPMLLSLRGIVLGTVLETSTNIVFSNNTMDTKHSIQFRPTDRDMLAMSRLAVRDCWQPTDTSTMLQGTLCRTADRPSFHFQDFCAFMTHRLQNSTGTTFVSFHGKWCNVCGDRHTASEMADINEVVEIYHCSVCFDFDLCADCRQRGKTCSGGGDHKMNSCPIPGVIRQLDEQTRAMLESSRGSGDWKRFDLSARQSFDGRTFIKIEGGRFGIASNMTQIGDLVVVLLDGRVPFVLRPGENGCTLIGHSYIHDMMDGEAIDMWRAGRLRDETFVLT